MSDHACRLNLAPGLDQRSRVVPDHDVGSSDKRDESRLCRDPGRLIRPPRPQARQGRPAVQPRAEWPSVRHWAWWGSGRRDLGNTDGQSTERGVEPRIIHHLRIPARRDIENRSKPEASSGWSRRASGSIAGRGTGPCSGSDRGAVAGDGPRYRRPLEHGLHSTLIAMRLGKRLEIDAETASQTYYACLLFYVGCTANADIAAEIFGDHSALTTYGAPVRFGSRPEMVAGLMRAAEVGVGAQGPTCCCLRGGADADRPPRPSHSHRSTVHPRG